MITDELDLENGNGTQLLPHYAYRFWLKVTTKYMNTGGLPQRLFALDQIAPLDRRAQSTEPSPKILNVTGAGNYNVNGKYVIQKKNIKMQINGTVLKTI